MNPYDKNLKRKKWKKLDKYINTFPIKENFQYIGNQSIGMILVFSLSKYHEPL